MYKILFIVYILNVIISVISTNQNLNIGKFDLRVNSIELCKGPKQKECGSNTVNLYNSTTLDYTLILKRKMKFASAKVVVQTNGRDLVRLQMRKPCEHVIIRQVLSTRFNLTSACAILPGKYISSYNLDKIAKSYYGGSFMYGDYSFKTLFLGDDCNVSCITVHVTFMPQEKN